MDGTGSHFSQHIAGVDGTGSHCSRNLLDNDELELVVVLTQALNTARSEAAGLGQALDQETERRRECEASSVEREDQLTQALHRLGEYERVSSTTSRNAYILHMPCFGY